MRTTFIAVIVAISLCFGFARADWVIYGAAYSCGNDGTAFELAPVIELSSADPAEVPIQEGFIRLKNGKNQLRCNIAGQELVAHITVRAPGAGQCEGGGSVSIDSMRMRGFPIVNDDQEFNTWCFSQDRRLNRIVVIAKGKRVVIKKCSATYWNWSIGYSNEKCDEQDLH